MKTQSQPVSVCRWIQTHCEDPENDLNHLNEEYVHILLVHFIQNT